MYIFFPSCNFNTLRPETAKKLRAMLAERMPVAGCCRFDTNEYTEDQTGLYLCQACRQVLEPKINLMSIWEYFDSDEEMTLPDYSGLTVGIQDCWRDRDHPEIHAAVRSLLKKMHVSTEELDEAKEKSVFCGNLHFEPKKAENIELMAKYPGKEIYEMPPEVEEALMREQVEKFKSEYILTDCNRCTRCITTGGGKPIHLLELVLGDFKA